MQQKNAANQKKKCCDHMQNAATKGNRKMETGTHSKNNSKYKELKTCSTKWKSSRPLGGVWSM